MQSSPLFSHHFCACKKPFPFEKNWPFPSISRTILRLEGGCSAQKRKLKLHPSSSPPPPFTGRRVKKVWAFTERPFPQAKKFLFGRKIYRWGGKGKRSIHAYCASAIEENRASVATCTIGLEYACTCGRLLNFVGKPKLWTVGKCLGGRRVHGGAEGLQSSAATDRGTIKRAIFRLQRGSNSPVFPV